MNLRTASPLLIVAALALYAATAHAERGDRDKPVHIEADRVTLDDGRQVGIFTGNVLLIQGTLTITGEQVIATQGRNGFQRGEASGAPAKFRQKRDGANEYVEGSGMRIEYDAAAGVMDIYGGARVKRGQQEVHGEHITYDLRKETFEVSGAHSDTPDRRVTVVIPPHAASAPQSGEPLPIRPDTRLIKQDDKP